MSQTMLLTKRLSTFLGSNTTPQLHTLLLITPTGKLLASASLVVASILRTQATVACSIWNLYHPYYPTTSSNVYSALPNSPTPEPSRNISSITIQLEFGIMVIRPLRCGLLFVSIGPSSTSSASQQANQSAQNQLPPSSPLLSAPLSPPLHDGREHQPSSENGTGDGSVQGASTALSEAGSATSTATHTANTLFVKRRAEELGVWLDGNLEGLVLSPVDGR